MTTTESTTNGKSRRRAGRTLIPAGEKREDKFVRLAVKRMNAVRGKVRQIKNLARYPHTEEQAMRIVGELKSLAADIESAFAPRGADEFRF